MDCEVSATSGATRGATLRASLRRRASRSASCAMPTRSASPSHAAVQALRQRPRRRQSPLAAPLRSAGVPVQPRARHADTPLVRQEPRCALAAKPGSLTRRASAPRLDLAEAEALDDRPHPAPTAAAARGTRRRLPSAAAVPRARVALSAIAADVPDVEPDALVRDNRARARAAARPSRTSMPSSSSSSRFSARERRFAGCALAAGEFPDARERRARRAAIHEPAAAASRRSGRRARRTGAGRRSDPHLRGRQVSGRGTA